MTIWAAARFLPSSETIDLTRHETGQPIVADFKKAFVYSDCWVEDARLVVLNAMDAAARGATVLTRTECLSARREDGVWRVELRHGPSGERRTVSARALVNTAGPWVTEVLSQRLGQNLTKRIRNVKGSHIVVPRLFDHAYPYIFQNTDKRVVFAIPLRRPLHPDRHDRRRLIRATWRRWRSPRRRRTISAPRSTAISRPRSSRRTWFGATAGVRPLFDDDAGSASQATPGVWSLELSTGD